MWQVSARSLAVAKLGPAMCPTVQWLVVSPLLSALTHMGHCHDSSNQGAQKCTAPMASCSCFMLHVLLANSGFIKLHVPTETDNTPEELTRPESPGITTSTQDCFWSRTTREQCRTNIINSVLDQGSTPCRSASASFCYDMRCCWQQRHLHTTALPRICGVPQQRQ